MLQGSKLENTEGHYKERAFLKMLQTWRTAEKRNAKRLDPGDAHFRV
jgi:hypothetical protein